MTIIFRKSVVSCITALLLPLSTFAANANSQFPPANVPATAKYMLIQEFDKMKISAGKIVIYNANNPLVWRLRQVSTPTDRKVQVVGYLPFNQYMQYAWGSKSSAFNAEHPNAVIFGYFSKDDHAITLTTKITSATYSAKNHTLTYTCNKPIHIEGKKLAGSSATFAFGRMYIDSLTGSYTPIY